MRSKVIFLVQCQNDDQLARPSIASSSADVLCLPITNSSRCVIGPCITLIINGRKPGLSFYCNISCWVHFLAFRLEHAYCSGDKCFLVGNLTLALFKINENIFAGFTMWLFLSMLFHVSSFMNITQQVTSVCCRQ